MASSKTPDISELSKIGSTEGDTSAKIIGMYISGGNTLADTPSKNLCFGCGVDMGECNPRQYCRKTYCPYE